MDWNWYFSSVAQSSAALVGVSLAFIVSRTIENSASDERAYAALCDFLGKASRLKQLACTARLDHIVSVHSKHAIHELAPKIVSCQTVEDLRNEFAERRHELFSPFASEQECWVAIADARALYANNRQQFSPPVIFRQSFPAMSSAQTDEHTRDVRLAMEIEEHIASLASGGFSMFRASLHAEDIRIVIRAALGLFLLGVIAPLSLLPQGRSSPLGESADSVFFGVAKWVVLAAVTGLFGWLLVFLLLRSKRVFDRESIKQAERMTVMSSYHERIGFYYENVIASDPARELQLRRARSLIGAAGLSRKDFLAKIGRGGRPGSGS